MQEISYYERQAERARFLADRTTDQQAREALAIAARDYAEIAKDLERGAVEVRHPELLTASQHDHAGSKIGRP